MWSSSSAEKDVDGEWEWGENTSLGRQMSSLESCLRCSICSDFFCNPHSLACGHVFCSECIRRHLDPKMNHTTAGICPSCRETASLAHLRPCRDFVETVHKFRSVRPPLLMLVQGQDVDVKPTSEENNSFPQEELLTNKSTPLRKMSHMDFHKVSKDKIKKALEKLTENCRKKLRLDGDKIVLERRYRDFVHLNNAQLGSSNPLSIDQIVTEITRRENAKDSQARKDKKSSQIASDLKGGKASAAAKNGYSSLIEQVRMRKESEKSKNAASSVPVDSSNGETPPNITSRGVWRIVYSEKFNAPFFYNTTTNTGQFKVPSELQQEFDCNRSQLVLEGDDSKSNSCGPSPKLSSKGQDEIVMSTYRESEVEDNVYNSLQCTLVDSQMMNGTPSHVPSPSVVVDDSSQSSDDEKQRCGQKAVFADDSSFSIATNLSSKYSESRNINPEHSQCPDSYTSSCGPEDSQAAEQSSDKVEDANECPHCTYINSPLALVCEICLGEITQLPKPVRRSKRIIENFSQQTSTPTNLYNTRAVPSGSTKKRKLS